MDKNLEKELEELEIPFQWNEVVDLWSCEVVRNKHLLARKILDKCLLIGKWLKKHLLVWKKTWNITCA